MIIRIGNDIKFDVHLTENDEPVEIKSVKARLINATVQAELDAKSSSERFPQEPTSDAYSPTTTEINSSGSYSYNVYPSNVVLNNIHVEYDAVVDKLDLTGWISVVFPAKDQDSLGTYNLIIQAEITDNSYTGKTRSITIDSPNVFTLVGTTEEGVDGTVEITIGSDPEPSPEPTPDPDPQPDPQPDPLPDPPTTYEVTLVDGINPPDPTYGTFVSNSLFVTKRNLL